MIHRSIVGSLERLVAHLTEVHAGAFPTWMAPVQVIVLPITGQQLPAAASVLRRLINAGLRAEISAPIAEPSAPGSEATALCLTKPLSAPVKPTATPFPCAFVPGWPLIPSRSETQPITSWPRKG